jgi:hypothetical protein
MTARLGFVARHPRRQRPVAAAEPMVPARARMMVPCVMAAPTAAMRVRRAMMMPAPGAMMMTLHLGQQAVRRDDGARAGKCRGCASTAESETNCEEGTGDEVTHCVLSFFPKIPTRQYERPNLLSTRRASPGCEIFFRERPAIFSICSDHTRSRCAEPRVAAQRHDRTGRAAPGDPARMSAASRRQLGFVVRQHWSKRPMAATAVAPARMVAAPAARVPI